MKHYDYLLMARPAGVPGGEKEREAVDLFDYLGIKRFIGQRATS